jgi:methyl-accepting chemotaxis protein
MKIRNLTLGKRIGLGFAGIIAIAGLLGGVAAWNMQRSARAAATTVTDLTAKYIPESEIGDRLKDAVSRAALSIRSYGFTAEEQYRTLAQTALAEVKQDVEAAKALAAQHPDLVKLKEHLAVLTPTLVQWEQCIQKTEASVASLEQTRVRLNQNAKAFVTSLDQLIARQEQKQAGEIQGATAAAGLLERTRKIALGRAIRSEGDAVRIAVFKAQALRDLQILEDGIKGFAAMDQAFEELKPLLKTPADLEELAQAQKAAHDYQTEASQVLADMKELNETGRIRAELGEKAMADAREFASAGMQRAVNDSETLGTRLSHTVFVVLGGVAIALLAGIGLALLISRSVGLILSRFAHAIADGSTQVAAAATQVAASSQTLAQGSSEQAAAVEETSASLEEMASMTKRNAESATQAKSLFSQARAAADGGVTDMAEMIRAMDEIKASSDDISKIIKSIDEIAFQTNILALNAAVEAARAGEAGMGFAVVAEEVRHLAQRSAQSAKETAAKIETSVRKSEHGVRISQKVAQSLSEIATKARQVDTFIVEIAQASEEQSQGVTQVNVAIGQIDQITQSTASTAEETASAAEELTAQASAQKQTVEDLLLLVGGTVKQSTTMAASPAVAASSRESTRLSGERQPARAKLPGQLNSRDRIAGFADFATAAAVGGTNGSRSH